MKLFTLVLIISLSSLTVIGQNLVPNPSFEEYLECPFSTAGLDIQLVNWYSWQESPDFFHVCSNDFKSLAGVPENVWGYQWPISGMGYAGIFTYVDYFDNNREYMAAPLLTPLILGESYYMMVFVSLCDSSELITRKCASNNIGMRFFKDPSYSYFPSGNAFHADNFAHLNYAEIIDDDQNWTLVEGWFTADDTYNWLAIGNFFDDENTLTAILNDQERCSVIYYVENVCVATDPADCEYLLSAHSKRPMSRAGLYPNPASETVRVSVPDGEKYELEIYDIQGRKIKDVQEVISGQEIDVSTLQKGIYVVRISNKQFASSLKLIVQ